MAFDGTLADVAQTDQELCFFRVGSSEIHVLCHFLTMILRKSFKGDEIFNFVNKFQSRKSQNVFTHGIFSQYGTMVHVSS